MAKLSAALLRRAARIAEQASKVQADLTEAFRDRYGVTYSDVDCDWLIDVLDYGGGKNLTVAECDRAMENCGAPRLALQSPPAKVEG
jgi:hypothetical protein